MFTPGCGADFFGQLPDGFFLGGESRQMRGQRDFWVFSEQMIGRQGLGAVNVQHGGRQPRSEEHSLNSSHVAISYAVFCLKKKKTTEQGLHRDRWSET